METQHININPENSGAEKKSESTGKAMKAAGKAAKFAGAVGLGVAGTMAAEAMVTPEDLEELIEDDSLASDSAEDNAEEAVVATPEPVNPNNIKIEEIEEIATDNTPDEDVAVALDIQPITAENAENIPDDQIVIVDVDTDIDLLDVDPTDETFVSESETEYDEDWSIDEIPNEELLADNPDQDFDIMNDIIA